MPSAAACTCCCRPMPATPPGARCWFRLRHRPLSFSFPLLVLSPLCLFIMFGRRPQPACPAAPPHRLELAAIGKRSLFCSSLDLLSNQTQTVPQLSSVHLHSSPNKFSDSPQTP